MKSYILILSIIVSVISSSCKSQKSASSSDSSAPKTMGVVSHKYKASGCSAVILVKQDGGEDLVLIPKDKLSGKFDVDGLKVSFDYVTLKMPQPQGCTTGIPAEIKNISKSK